MLFSVSQLVVGFVLAYIVVFLLFAIKRKMKSPEKSFKNCCLSVGLTPVRMMKLGPFKQGKISLQSAMQVAMKKAKLTDFGVDNGGSFAEVYSKVSCSYCG